MFKIFSLNKNLTFKRRIILFLVIGLLTFAVMPYIIIPLLLPGSADANSKLFNGEWFNKTKPLTADQYQTLNRWAHYYGYHGCEPEVGNCPYKGVLGNWKLVLNYLREEKPCPVKDFIPNTF
ncbi:MAG: hypothetical protein ABFC94_07305 [Syntrophomonas sp.]